MSKLNLYDYVETIADFPKKGILFRDISPLLENNLAYNALISKMISYAKNYKIDVVAGLDARGFLFSTLLAYKLKIGSLMIRKPNKLPGNLLKQTYSLEYADSTLSLQKNRIIKNKNVLIVDDLLATGGTLKCAENLIDKAGGHARLSIVAIELLSLKGRLKLNSDVFSILQYD